MKLHVWVVVFLNNTTQSQTQPVTLGAVTTRCIRDQRLLVPGVTLLPNGGKNSSAPPLLRGDGDPREVACQSQAS